MTAAVVQTVTATSMVELRAQRDAAVGDMVELRLDYVKDIDVAGALGGRRKPVIVTCRAAWEGGRFEGDEATRLAILARAIESGAEYVDVEWKADRRSLPVNPATTLVLSHHDFAGMPSDLTGLFRAMAAERTGIVKVAVTPRRLRDCIALRDASRIDAPHVAIAMGPVGQLTRVAPILLGSRWTYGGTAAPGQTSASELIDVYRVGRQSMSTALYGVAGAPLAHSASPAMHNAAFTALGINAVYVTFETGDADELLEVAEAFGLRGASVTAPLKTGVFGLVPRHDELSEKIGALNTLRRDGGDWEGRNYDVPGFLSPFVRREEPLQGRRCVVVGAGGAARTALWALQSYGARVEVAARREDRARSLAGEFGVDVASWPPAPGWDLLVNTTPAGTWPEIDAMPLEADAVRGRMVYDLIYNPEDTALLQVARAHGAETIGGLEMLVGQACHQFEWWTGRPAPREIMADAARAFLLSRQAHA
jgi:3-dehydroquinate dehydratase/shikimate dehydrogenase